MDWKNIRTNNLEETIIIITADHGNFIPNYTDTTNLEIDRSNIDKKLWKLEDKIPKLLKPLMRKSGKIIEKRRQLDRQIKIKNLNMSPFVKRNLLYSDLFTMFNPISENNFLFDDIVKVPLILTGYKIDKIKK